MGSASSSWSIDFAYQQEKKPQQREVREQKPQMVIESVKGKVSNANRHLTDADLERRFQMQDHRPEGSLMTEEQVLRMIRQEKKDVNAGSGPGSASASRRIQRELAEWEAKKEEQRTRVKSPHRFERMVVARR